MKLRLSQIVNGYITLQQSFTEKLPTDLLFILYRNVRLMKTEVDTYEKTRVDLIKTKYGIKLETGEFEVPPKNMEKFSEEMKRIGETEIDLDIKTIRLEDCKEIQLSLMQLSLLDWMFLVPEE